MRCPFCRAEDTKVVDSRLISEGTQVRRRRQCLICHERFSTFETAELLMPAVVKQDGRREPFNDNKLRAGLLKALEKRPVSVDALEEAMATLVRRIRGRGEREIASSQIGELVMQILSTLDHIAYVRFASVYKRFQDVSDFRQTLDDLNRSKNDE
ncbi:MAG: transcriptional regulator NrdR [Legionella sp.]|nr:transcriptional regulator NrdR [Legionella sp.]